MLAPSIFFCDMIIIKFFTWFMDLVHLYESQCLTYTKNFIKIKNHFDYFEMYLQILAHRYVHFFAQIYFNILSYEIWNVIFLPFDFLVFWPIMTCKNIVKIFLGNDMVKGSNMGTLKITMWLHYWAPCNFLSLFNIISILIMLIL